MSHNLVGVILPAKQVELVLKRDTSPEHNRRLVEVLGPFYGKAIEQANNTTGVTMGLCMNALVRAKLDTTISKVYMTKDDVIMERNHFIAMLESPKYSGPLKKHEDIIRGDIRGFANFCYGADNITEELNVVISNTTKESEYDTITIGGRWENSLQLKDGSSGNYAKIKEIIWNNEPEEESRKALEQKYQELITHGNGMVNKEFYRNKYPALEDLSVIIRLTEHILLLTRLVFTMSLI